MSTKPRSTPETDAAIKDLHNPSLDYRERAGQRRRERRKTIPISETSENDKTAVRCTGLLAELEAEIRDCRDAARNDGPTLGEYWRGREDGAEIALATVWRYSANVEVCDGGRKTSELKQDANRHSQH